MQNNARFMLPLGAGRELRLMEEREAEELYLLVKRNWAHLRQWLSWIDDEASAEEIRIFIRQTLRRFQKLEGFQLGIRSHGQLAGVIGYELIDWPNRHGQLSYWLGAEFQGQGLVTSAARVLLDYAFEELALNRIDILCATGNQRSRAIPEHLGFVQCGIMPDGEWLYDHFVDVVVYCLLEREWKTRRAL